MNAETTAEEAAALLSTSIHGKHVLITGVSQGGLGAEFTRVVAKHAALLVIGGRSVSKLEETEKFIKEEIPAANIRPLIIDLGSEESVRKAAAEVNTYPEPIDVLINNASIMGLPTFTTWANTSVEAQLGTNFLAPFLFTNLIKPRLAASPAPRIVNVSSSSHKSSPVRFDDLSFKDGNAYNALAAYGQSKTAIILFTVALADKWKTLNAGAFSVHPGSIKTNLSRHIQLSMLPEIMWRVVLPKLWRALTFQGTEDLYFRTIPQGAATYIVAAFDPSIINQNGSYLCDLAVMNERAMDYALDKNGTNDAILDEHDLELLVPLPDEPAVPAPELEQRKDPLAAVLSSLAPSSDPQTLTIDEINTSLTMNFLSALSSTSTSTRLPTFDDDLDLTPTTMSNTSNEMTMEWFNLTFGGIGAEPVYGAASDALDLQATTSPTPSLVHSTPASSIVSSSASTLLATPSDPFLFDFASSSFPASLFPTDDAISPSLLAAPLPPSAAAPPTPPTRPVPAPKPSSSKRTRPACTRYSHCSGPVSYNGSGFAVNHVVEPVPKEKPLPTDPEARRKEVNRRHQAGTRKRKLECVKGLEERVKRLEAQVRGLGEIPVE
ncbi:short-chain dehydrogenase [Pseudohyphozyma bogoriensis]|nr:short-chain dehydrogenase [Pseudohyphozyma bogoriensis]